VHSSRECGQWCSLFVLGSLYERLRSPVAALSLSASGSDAVAKTSAATVHRQSLAQRQIDLQQPSGVLRSGSLAATRWGSNTPAMPTK